MSGSSGSSFPCPPRRMRTLLPSAVSVVATLSGVVITSDGLLNILSAFFSPATRIGLIDTEDEDEEEAEDGSEDEATEE